MCLAVPGQVVSVATDALGVPTGVVSFGGVTKQVCLAWLPGIRAGDWVMVHVGFALSAIDEAEAREVFRILEGLDGPGEAPAREGSAPEAPGGRPGAARPAGNGGIG